MEILSSFKLACPETVSYTHLDVYKRQVDMEIPEEFYQTVAKVLAFVYKLKKKDI